MATSVFPDEDFDLEDSSDSELERQDDLLQTKFRENKSGLLDIGLGQLMLQNFKQGTNENVHDQYVDRIIKEHKRATAHLNQSKVKFNINLASKMRDVKLNRGDLASIIKENVTKLKSQNKQALQDAVDFGDFESFSQRFLTMTMDFFTGLKTHSEILKNKKMKKMQMQLRQKMYGQADQTAKPR